LAGPRTGEPRADDPPAPARTIPRHPPPSQGGEGRAQRHHPMRMKSPDVRQRVFLVTRERRVMTRAGNGIDRTRFSRSRCRRTVSDRKRSLSRLDGGARWLQSGCCERQTRRRGRVCSAWRVERAATRYSCDRAWATVALAVKVGR
jgi:hypothetical protein